MFETVEFDEDQQTYSDRIVADAEVLGQHIQDLPESRERSIALTNLEQAVMWANRCLAVNDL